MNRRELFDLHLELSKKAQDLMMKKNEDYTSQDDNCLSNLDGSSFVGVSIVKGILIRMMDKIKRIQSFDEKGYNAVSEESIEDTIIDLINYSVLLNAALKMYITLDEE